MKIKILKQRFSMVAQWSLWKNHNQVLVHVNGDLGVEKLINILEKRQAEYPREDHRFTIIHFANSTDKQVEKLKITRGYY